MPNADDEPGMNRMDATGRGVKRGVGVVVVFQLTLTRPPFSLAFV
jgi:hypothetical protein